MSCTDHLIPSTQTPNGFAITAAINPEGKTSVSVMDGPGSTVMLTNGEGHIQTICHYEVLPSGGGLHPPSLSAISILISRG